MKQRLFLFLIHLPVWVVAFLVSYFFSTDDFPGKSNSYVFFSTLTFFLWALGSFYIFYSFLVPKYLEQRKTKHWLIYSGLFVFFVIPFSLFSLLFFFHFIFKLTSYVGFPEPVIISVLQFWLLISALTLFLGILGSLYRFSIDWFNNLHIKKEIENIRLKNELNAIKSRLNPHFLFNTLNNIDTLIQTNPPKASTVLSGLSDLLRYVVYETENEKIEIKKEMDVVKKYIDLEKIRLSNPDSVSFTCAMEHDFLIPPMIFIPFIENGFKHCNLNEQACKLSISFLEKNNELVFRCVNPMNMQEHKSKEKGIGLKLITERLKLLYPNHHSLQISRQNNEFDVSLKINLIHD